MRKLNTEGMGFNVVAMGQGFASMSPPTKELMKLTLEQRIAHGGIPSFDGIWIIYTFVLTLPEISRQINQNQCGNETSESVYDTRGLLVSDCNCV